VVTPVVEAVAKNKAKVRVMVVDDSATIRGVLTRWIETEPELKVVASAFNGRSALDVVRMADPDVIVLDIEMPGMDGITALPLLIKAAPRAKVVMASTLTRRNAEISLKALSLGATDYLAKPTSLTADGAADSFRRDLVAKLLTLGRAGSSGLQQTSKSLVEPSKTLRLRPASNVVPQLVAIGSSTGGPQALAQVITELAPGLRVPVLITQHMPATFTSILAEHLSRISGLKCQEGRAGQSLTPGSVYVAPGDFHMRIVGRPGTIEITQSPPENFCRPSVDPMFRSVAAAYGPTVLAIVLTGMGSDGCEGARAVAMAGGTVIAQDEASSVVWGMPAAVAHAGLASAILPLKSIAAEARKYLGVGAR
jgi:two-component system chemotaxis response regulator CheB